MVEITAALAIIALALLTLTSATFTSDTTRQAAKDRDLALQAIESTLEDILRHSSDDFASLPSAYAVDGLEPPTGRAAVLLVTFENQGSDLTRITLEAEWENRLGPGSLDLVYLHADIGG